MQFDLRFVEPPLWPVARYLRILFFSASLVGAISTFLTALRGKATPSLHRAWIASFAVGTLAAGALLGVDLMGIEPNY